MREGLYGAFIQIAPGSGEQANIIFYKYKGDPSGLTLQGWKPSSENSILLSVTKETQGRSEARQLAHDTLLALDKGELPYSESPFPPPAKPVQLEEIEHAKVMAKAVIVLWPDGKYEAIYLALAPDMDYLPAAAKSPDPNYSWGRPRAEVKTYANTYEEIAEAAKRELDEIVKDNPRIKPRTKP